MSMEVIAIPTTGATATLHFDPIQAAQLLRHVDFRHSVSPFSPTPSTQDRSMEQHLSRSTTQARKRMALIGTHSRPSFCTRDVPGHVCVQQRTSLGRTTRPQFEPPGMEYLGPRRQTTQLQEIQEHTEEPSYVLVKGWERQTHRLCMEEEHSKEKRG